MAFLYSSCLLSVLGDWAGCCPSGDTKTKVLRWALFMKKNLRFVQVWASFLFTNVCYFFNYFECRSVNFQRTLCFFEPKKQRSFRDFCPSNFIIELCFKQPLDSDIKCLNFFLIERVLLKLTDL